MKKPINIPPGAGSEIVRSMRRYFAEPDAIKRGEIAVVTRLDLLAYMPKGAKLKVSEVVELFHKMREELQP